jgi:phospholipid transport system substrate-binding protein
MTEIRTRSLARIATLPLTLVAIVALMLAFAMGSARAAHANAQEMVRSAATQALEALKQSREELQANPAKIYDFVQQYLLPYFDFEYSSRLVLGRNWRTASPEERERFQEAFQRTLIRSYGSAMLKYSDQEIVFLPVRDEPGKDNVTVKTEIDVGDSKPVAVDYNVRLVDGEWKVYDVIIDGISVVVNYRGTFGSEIKRLGGLTPLIEKMEERNKSNVLEPAPDEFPTPGIQ